MNKQLPTVNLEESSLSYEEISKYIDRKSKIKWKKEDILYTLSISTVICIAIDKEIYGVLVCRKIDNGHHVHFIGAEDRKSLKELVFLGLQQGIWPKTAERRQKRKNYSRPEKLIEKLLSYG